VGNHWNPLGKEISMRTRLTICVMLLSVAVLPLAGNSTQTTTQSMLKHFYVYNECYKPISSMLTYVPLDSEATTTTQVSIGPGMQTMLGTTYKDSVVTESSSDDRTFHWGTRTFSVSYNEYTHVITCNCPTGASECKPPVKWPNASSRQYPDTPSVKGK
jgi:hypothetical protein